MKLHRGINSANITGEGLEGLPGLLIAIAFVFFFLGIFLPRQSNWPLVLFLFVEVGAATLYLLLARRSRRESERMQKALHEINEDERR